MYVLSSGQYDSLKKHFEEIFAPHTVFNIIQWSMFNGLLTIYIIDRPRPRGLKVEGEVEYQVLSNFKFILTLKPSDNTSK